MNKNSPGSIRPGQLLTTFGPGSIVDLRKDSVMILGLDDWRNTGREIHEHRLEKALGVESFRHPSVSTGYDVPCTSFPKYRVCPGCGRISNSFIIKPGSVPLCDCKKPHVETHPARLVVACNKGHIDDFPWFRWVHGKKKCDNPKMFIQSRGISSALSDIVIICKTCNAKASLAGALGPQGVKRITGKCTGKRPWLGDVEEGCQAIPRGLQRGASNVYFSSTISALSIPPWTGRLQQDLDRHWATIKAIARNNYDQLNSLISILFPGSIVEDVLAAITSRLEGPATFDFRKDEWLALTEPSGANDPDFRIQDENIPDEIKKYISRIVLVSRLREVRVLKGFTRIDPPDPEDRNRSKTVSISGSGCRWLPAVEVRGEGVFIVLNREELERWESLDAVRERSARLINSYRQWRQERGHDAGSIAHARFMLLHTLAHLLILQLSLDCGYSSSSIRERIYSGPDMYGILLYTASVDSDGSLGGLVQQGLSNRFITLLKRVLESAQCCSSDPLCAEQIPSGTSSVNGAACHSCALVPETCCEWGNLLLDRAFLMDLSDIGGTGYFNQCF